MAKELPYFRFTVQEWQNGDITAQSDSVQGVFVNVMCYYWANDCEVSEERLFKRFKSKTKTIQKLIECEAIKCQNGIVSISFLQQQLSELKQNTKFFSDMGKLGQKAKKKKAPLKPPLNISLSYKDNIKIIINHLNTTLKTKYRDNSDKTVSVISTRLNEGFSVDDFKTVIDKKAKEWKGTEYEKFLRPETLFGRKFEGYLNQKNTAPKKEVFSI